MWQAIVGMAKGQGQKPVETSKKSAEATGQLGAMMRRQQALGAGDNTMSMLQRGHAAAVQMGDDDTAAKIQQAMGSFGGGQKKQQTATVESGGGGYGVKAL